jgi:hypothetical protein
MCLSLVKSKLLLKLTKFIQKNMSKSSFMVPLSEYRPSISCDPTDYGKRYSNRIKIEYRQEILRSTYI